MCSNGECVNDNTCDCSYTNFKGALCDEHYILRRIKILDILIFIISIGLVLFSIILLIGIFIYRDHKVIKAGNFISFY